MTEKQLIINNRKILHKGIFRIDELFNTINQALDEKGYQKKEKKYEEEVTITGKNSYIELRPFKEKSAYIAFMFKIKINMENITEIIKEIEGIPRTFQKGDLTLYIDAWLLSDKFQRWGMEPIIFFLKAIIHKYIYHFPLEGSHFGELKSDANYLSQQIKALLNLYKYQTHNLISETTQTDSEEVDVKKGLFPKDKN